MSDLHHIWGHRWVTSKAKEQDSDINRKGLIATEDIAAGETVVVYGGIIIPKADLPKYREMVGDYDVPFDKNFSIAPTSREDAINVVSVNHSCEPTLGWKNAITLVTIRDVKKGEELAPDYAMHGGYVDEMICNCGTTTCRKIITSEDWKNPAIRAKYGKWFTSYLQEQF
jgi:SET domain-containing protein